MARHRLNLFRLPTSSVSDELRAATPKVNGAQKRRVFLPRRKANAHPRIATIQTATPSSVIRAKLSTGGTAYRGENGDWHLIVGKTGTDSQPLGQRWCGICELAYQTALRESASAQDA
jgi:hypothetical protein